VLGPGYCRPLTASQPASGPRHWPEGRARCSAPARVSNTFEDARDPSTAARLRKGFRSSALGRAALVGRARRATRARRAASKIVFVTAKSRGPSSRHSWISHCAGRGPGGHRRPTCLKPSHVDTKMVLNTCSPRRRYPHRDVWQRPDGRLQMGSEKLQDRARRNHQPSSRGSSTTRRTSCSKSHWNVRPR